METNGTDLVGRNRNIIRIVLGTALILLVPLLAMQVTDEVNWDVADFVVIGTLLLGTGLMYELVARRVSNPKHRVVIGVVLAAFVLLVWAELVVGVFGSPISGS